MSDKLLNNKEIMANIKRGDIGLIAQASGCCYKTVLATLKGRSDNKYIRLVASELAAQRRKDIDVAIKSFKVKNSVIISGKTFHKLMTLCENFNTYNEKEEYTYDDIKVQADIGKDIVDILINEAFL